MQISAKPLHKLTDSLLFLFISLGFLVIFIITFKGFDGSDDMHYAMLAAQVVHHRFNAFFAGDIFSGRLGLIYWQALLYRIGGINPVMTQFGTLFCSILCCYLVVFRLLTDRTPVKMITAACIFYFNPVLHSSITGIYPDAYVMLGAVLLILLMKSVQAGSGPKPFSGGLWSGLIVFLTSLFKEDAVILLVALLLFTLIFRSRWQTLFFMGTGLAALILFSFYGLFLWANTGNFFLRLAQISNVQQVEILYPQKCHALLSFPDLLIRLTYGPWIEALRQGFYPVVISFVVLVAARIFGLMDARIRTDKIIFLVLLFTVFYFPARMDRYQPVCPDMRQFLFLLPFGTIVLTETIASAFEDRKRWQLLMAVTSLCLAGIIVLSLNKWKWLTYGELVFLTGLIPLADGRRGIFAAIFLVMLAFTGLERLFFLKNAWFSDLTKVYALHKREFAWIPDYDNYMQWRLLTAFADTAVYYPGFVLNPPDVGYKPVLTGFRPLLIVVNRWYSPRTPEFFSQLDGLFNNGTLAEKETQGEISVYRALSPAAVDSLNILMNREFRR